MDSFESCAYSNTIVMCFKSKFQHELFNILGGNLQKVDATSQKDEGYEDLQRCFSTPSSQGNLLKGIDNKIVRG